MALAEARARHAALLDFPLTSDADDRSLEALGRWLMRFSPAVCVQPPRSIFLEATGMERLFGSVKNFRDRVTDALAALHIIASVAIAPTPGAAWALAAFGQTQWVLQQKNEIQPALALLPPDALRLDEKPLRLLASLGVKTIAALLRLSRKDLAVRFGAEILLRIDQALGSAPEPLTYLVHRAPIAASLEFESAVESLDAIWLAVQTLLGGIAAQLAERGLGARALNLTFNQPYGLPVHKQLQLARPSRDEKAMFKLLCCALENLQAREGFISIALAVPVTQRLDGQQTSLVNAEEERDAEALDHLIERLRARLNDDVQWGELVESNLPELACRTVNYAPAGRAIPSALRSAIDVLRPLRLLPQPRPLKVIVMPSQSRDGHPVSFTDNGHVHRLEHIRGPERITGQWWNGRLKIRDYFDVLDAVGSRYWIFRVAQTGRWFLHGIFQ